MQILRGLRHLPLRMAFSPDGRLLAVGENRSWFHVWDVTRGRADPLWSRSDGWLARYSVFSPDGETLASIHYDGVTRWGARTGHESDVPGLDRQRAAQFTPDGRFVIASDTNQGASVLRLQCLQPGDGGWVNVWQSERRCNPNHYYRHYSELLFSADGERAARVFSLTRGRRSIAHVRIEVLAVATGEVVAEWGASLPAEIREGAVAPDGTVALIYQRGLYGITTTIPKSAPVKRLNSTLKHFTSVAFSRDGSRLATTSNDTAATIWDPTTWEVRKRYEWNIGRLCAVCFAPDGLRCAAGSDTGQVVVWDLDD